MSIHDEQQDYQRTFKEFLNEKKRGYDSRNIWDVMRENPRVVLRYPTLDSILFNNPTSSQSLRRSSERETTINEYKERYHLPDDKFKILFEIDPPLIFAEHPIFLNLIDILDRLKKDDPEVKRLLKVMKDHFIQSVEIEMNIANLIYFTSIFMNNLLILNNRDTIDLSILNEIKYYIDIIMAYLLNYMFTTQKLEYISSNVFPFKPKSNDLFLNPMTFNMFLTTIQDKYHRLFNVDNQNKEVLIKNIVDNASRVFKKPTLRQSFVSRRALKHYSRPS
jgi:ribosomal protein S21